MPKNYGFAESIQEFTAYVLGQSAVPFIYYNESGDWSKWLPRYEAQADYFETYCCTVFGTLNCIETFHKFLYGEEPNYSERFTAILSGLNGTQGIDPQVPIEAIRNEGVVDQKDFPMVRDKARFFDPAELTGSLRAKGQNWVLNHDFQHEWLWKTRPENYMELLKEGLKSSPLGVSVTAWRKEGDVYVSDNGGNNHWVMLFKIDDEGYPWVFDSYDHSIKKLSKDHNIRRAKRIWLNKKTKKAMLQHVSILEKLLKALRSMMKQTLVDVCASALGTDVTPKDTVDDTIACAETVTTLMKKVYPETPIITGTYTLWEYLKDTKNGWKQVNEYEPGCVVVAPTGLGKQGAIGHAWIVQEDGTLASNNSFGVYRGKFTKNYTPGTAEKKYTGEYKIPLYIFKRA